MKFKLVKIQRFSGNKASVYTVIVDNEPITLFENFILENRVLHKSEISELFKSLYNIGKIGARSQFFEHFEGSPGDGVCALKDIKRKLRLYCIRNGTQMIILGGGGPKDKNIRAFQEDEKLTQENYLLREISNIISEGLRSKEIVYSNNGLDFEGKLEFNSNEDE